MSTKCANTCSFCGKSDSSKRCSRCKNVFYCSREHQIKHWKNHKLSCSEKLNEGADNTVTEQVQTGEHTDVEETSETKTQEITGVEENTFDVRPYKKNTFPKPQVTELYYLSQFAAENLKAHGYCVIDDILPQKSCQSIYKEVLSMYEDGILVDGQLAGGHTSGVNAEKVVNKSIRSDKISWIEGTDEEQRKYPSICELIGETMDMVVAGMNAHFDQYVLSGRTKAMVACYPGNGTAYKKHIDNPSGDGRLITCIVYLNENWDVQKNGGVLRIFPTNLQDDFVDVEPVMNRMLLFWSDSRNPHEVQPAYATRYAITIWYFDQSEREKAKQTQIEEDVARIRGDIALLDVKTKKTEKEIVQKKIESESVKALNVLSEEELDAICTLVGSQPDPRAVLTKLGIAKAIQDVLVPEIQRRLARQ